MQSPFLLQVPDGDSVPTEPSLRLAAQRTEGDRQGLLKAIVGGLETLSGAPLVEQFARVFKEGGRVRLHLPPELIAGLKDGSLRWKEARDGSGIIPIAVSTADGTWQKQVRLRIEEGGIDRAQLSAAAANAVTHALLRQILERLAVIEAKVDRVLANQQAAWRGKIVAGAATFDELMKEPGRPAAFETDLANARQSVQEGLQEGLQQLQGRLATLQPGVFSQLRSILVAISRPPSVEVAQELDKIREDVEWCLFAARALAGMDLAADRPQTARDRVQNVLVELSLVLQPAKRLRRRARYSQERDTFWAQELPGMLECQPEPKALTIEATSDDLIGILRRRSEESQLQTGVVR